MKTKKILSILLTVVIIFTLVPTVQIAAEEPVVEAIWGTTGGELTQSGTFEDVRAAIAGATDDTKLTIKLQSDVASCGSVNIHAGEYEIDLCGHTVNMTSSISVYGGKLTLKDTSGEGKIIYTDEGSRMIDIFEPAIVNIKGGTYEGFVPLVINSGAEVTIEGGIFKATGSCTVDTRGTLTVSGGTFHTGGSCAIWSYGNTSITDADFVSEYSNIFLAYCEGKLDLSGFTDVEGTTLLLEYGIENFVCGEDTIKLAEDAYFYGMGSNKIENVLSYFDNYEIKTGTVNTVTFEANGAEGEMEQEYVLLGETYLLPECAFVHPDNQLLFSGWKVQEDLIVPAGESVDVSGDLILTAQWERFSPIYVGGVAMEDGDYLATDADKTTKDMPENGYAYYKDGKLTLNNYSYTGEGFKYNGEGFTGKYLIYVSGNADINITLEGENILENTASSNADGIVVENGDLTIEGDGSLDMTTDDDTVSANNIVINNGTIKIESYEDDGFSADSVTINDGTVDITAYDDDGIDATLGGVTINNGDITICAEDHAIEANGDVNIRYGTLMLTSKDDEVIYVYTQLINEDIEVGGGDVLISGGDITMVAESGDGIDVNEVYDEEGNFLRGGNIIISGGNVNVTATSDGLEASGKVEISSGHVIVKIDTEEDGNYAIIAKEGIVLDSDVNMITPQDGEITTYIYDAGTPETEDDTTWYAIKDSEGNFVKEAELETISRRKPSSGGGGGSSWAPTTTTTKNEDGSTTKVTENKKTGTVTEVTTHADGSTTTVENKKDGSKVTVEKKADGSKVTTKTDAEGEKITEIDVPENAETEVIISAENAEKVTKVIVTDKDGNVTEITDFEVTDKGIKISVSSDCTAVLSVDDSDAIPQNKTFDDVHSKDHWAKADVDYVIAKGLMNGVSENNFAPDDKLTRAMLVTILYRNEGEPATNRSIPFSDVDMSAYYANAVIWAQQNGIVNGVTETEFAPENNITREQIASIMFRYAIYKGMETVTMEENLHFEDSSEISEYAVSAMNWALGNELMKGKTAATINPKDNATRAEIAAILHRMMETDK